jgi:hypothetical protein
MKKLVERFDEAMEMSTWEVTFKNSKAAVRVKARSTREAFTKAGKQKGLSVQDALAMGDKATKVNNQTSKMQENMTDSDLKKMVDLLLAFVRNAKSNMLDFDKGSQEQKEYTQDIKYANHLIKRYK